mgnify:CR=1 FL=1
MGRLVGKDQTTRRHEHTAHALTEGHLYAGNLVRGFPPDLPDRLLHGEHAVHSRMGIGEAAPVGVHGQFPARRSVSFLNEGPSLAPSHEAQVFQAING